MQYKLRQYFRGLERYTRASAKLNDDRRVSQENDIEWSLAPTRKIRLGDHIHVSISKKTLTLDNPARLEYKYVAAVFIIIFYYFIFLSLHFPPNSFILGY